MINVQCSACGKQISVKDEMAGHRGGCPACGNVIQVPVPQSNPGFTLGDDLLSEIPAPGVQPAGGAPGQLPAPGADPFAPQHPAGGNPYTPPHTQFGAQHAAGQPCCPNCRATEQKKVGWTWWGGIIGPWLLSHVVCLSCGTGYNRTTGKSNNTAIAIMMAVSVGLGVVIFIVSFMLALMSND